MKIAYLILAHHHPHRLKRLIQAIEAPWADIFIHIDKKVDQIPFEKCLQGKNVVFIKERIRVNWKGYSAVEAILTLLKTAYSSGYKHYKLLSGVCHPIRSRSYIHNFLKEHNESFLSLWGKLGTRKAPRNTDPAVTYHYFIDTINIENFLRPDRFRAAPIKYFLLHPIEITYWSLFYLLVYPPFAILKAPSRLFRKLLPKKTPPAGLDIYGGDTFWLLHHDFVIYLFDFIAKNPQVIEYFKYANTPDEYFIPSLLIKSGLPLGKGLLHANFYKMDKPPYNIERMEKIANKPTILFARKFDSKSLALLKSLQDETESAPSSNGST